MLGTEPGVESMFICAENKREREESEGMEREGKVEQKEGKGRIKERRKGRGELKWIGSVEPLWERSGSILL